MPENEFDFERGLDEALQAYADPQDAGQPRLLTARVMEAVEVQRKRRFWVWGFAAALPVAACLLVVAFLLPVKRHAAPPQIAYKTVTPAVPAKLPPVEPQAVAHVERVRAQTRTALKSEKAPKLARFPAPEPLTQQQKLLIAFATQVPEKEREATIQAQRRAAEPLHISQLVIAPIDIKPIATQP